jgi:Ca2+-binding RTX toxin-like protein
MTTSTVNFSGLNRIDSLLIGTKWGGSTGSGATVTYSFMNTAPSYASPEEQNNFVPFSAAQITTAQQAFQLWEEVSGIDYVEVSNAGAGGDIRLGARTDLGGAYAYYPGDNAGGDIWFDNDWVNLQATIHEIGHAVGLKHPGNYDAGGNFPPPPYLPSSEDSWQYTVMSYNAHPGSGVESSTPMLYDIATIQYLYGANNNTRTGNNTYAWNTAFAQTIWDAGGVDTISAANQILAVTINLTAGTFSSIGPYSNGSSTPASNNLAIAYNVTIENAIGGSGNDDLRGNTGSNDIRGNSGNDYLFGDDGTDVLYGGTGNDFLVGWNGSDTMYGAVDNDTLWAGNENDWVYGEDGDDQLAGWNNNDYLDGGNGNDRVDGEYNDDTLYGGFGTDTLYGGDGNDRLDSGTPSAYDTANEKLYGDAGDDYLLAGNGADYLDGGSGIDALIGGLGNDTYVVESVGDVVTESPNSGTDTVISSITYTLGSDVNYLRLSGSIAINGTGNNIQNRITGNSASNILSGLDGNDTLTGSGGNDSLNGGTGNDSLVGGAGADTLTGGSGQDRFTFTTKTEGLDRITDFAVVDDTIDVSRAGFGGGLTAGAVITSAQFFIGAAAHDSSDRFIYNNSTGALLFDADGTGATTAIQFARLSTGLSLTNNDIFVIA